MWALPVPLCSERKDSGGRNRVWLGNGCFKEELANTETFELILEGGIQVCWGKIGRRVIPRVKACPHCSRQDIYLEGSSISWAPQGLVGAGSDETCLATVSHFNSSFHPFLFIHSATGTDHESTALYISRKLLAHKLLLRLCVFKESITYNIMNATTWYLK